MSALAQALRSHTMAKRHPWRCAFNVLLWQLRSRIQRECRVRFVNESVLIAEHGMTGLTGNIYFGLHEFDSMAFALHYLRTGDLFVDVGANAGSYTVLAGAAVGSDALAVEPNKRARSALERNIRANAIEQKTMIVPEIASDVVGECRFTIDADTTNQVVQSDASHHGATEIIKCRPLDMMLGGRTPSFVKIDVEGHEGQAIRGMTDTLSAHELRAVLVELSADRNLETGETPASAILRAHGFQPHVYNGTDRSLQAIDGHLPDGNVLFLRDVPLVRDRVNAAPSFLLHAMGEAI